MDTRIDGVPVTVNGEPTTAQVRVDTEQVEMPPSLTPEPDPDWEHVDPAGHRHRWDGSTVASVRRVVTGRWWCGGCHDHHEDTRLECVDCGAPVTPGVRPPSPFGTVIAGLTTVEFAVPIYRPRGCRVVVEWNGHRYDTEAVWSYLESGEPPSTRLRASERSGTKLIRSE